MGLGGGAKKVVSGDSTFCLGEVLPYNRLIGMCHGMGSHFHDWID